MNNYKIMFKDENVLVALKSILLVLFGLSILLVYGCQNKGVAEGDFLLTVDHDENIEIGKPVTFYCKLVVFNNVKVNHNSQLISYEVNGTRETITGQAIVEYFSKGKEIERKITLTFEEKGNYTIVFFSEFEKADEGATRFRIRKEIKITVR